MFFRNWGLRGTVSGKAVQKLRRETQNRQILKSPGQVVIIAEASAELERLLHILTLLLEGGAKVYLDVNDAVGSTPFEIIARNTVMGSPENRARHLLALDVMQDSGGVVRYFIDHGNGNGIG